MQQRRPLLLDHPHQGRSEGAQVLIGVLRAGDLLAQQPGVRDLADPLPVRPWRDVLGLRRVRQGRKVQGRHRLHVQPGAGLLPQQVTGAQRIATLPVRQRHLEHVQHPAGDRLGAGRGQQVVTESGLPLRVQLAQPPLLLAHQLLHLLLRVDHRPLAQRRQPQLLLAGDGGGDGGLAQRGGAAARCGDDAARHRQGLIVPPLLGQVGHLAQVAQHQAAQRAAGGDRCHPVGQRLGRLGGGQLAVVRVGQGSDAGHRLLRRGDHPVRRVAPARSAAGGQHRPVTDHRHRPGGDRLGRPHRPGLPQARAEHETRARQHRR